MTRMSRRGFISGAALGGYTLWVRAPALAESPPAPPSSGRFASLAPRPGTRGGWPSDPHMTRVELEADILVAGGGMAGVCAAIAAAREGARVMLVQDRSRLGGNASSEIRMHIVGADHHGARPGWREGGLIEEFRLDDAVANPHRAWELWDLMLYDKCVREPNLTLLLDTAVTAAETEDGRVRRVIARCDKTEHLYRIAAKIFVDATGDSRLALEAGAEFRVGREDKSEFGESLAADEATPQTQGSSILFTARRHDRPMPFRPPPWARTITAEHLRHRPVGKNSWEYGYWWIELGGAYDTIRDNERLRFELLAIVLGVWDHIKNSGRFPDAANWALETIGMIPGKRESRRVMGDHILTQVDVQGAWTRLADPVAIGGWPIDDHPSEGFDAPEKPPFIPTRLDEPYNIPLGALYSRNVPNLMMAGRNISCTHMAFCSTRVMATCSVIGQAVGTAAAMCCRLGCEPRALRADPARVRELQQILLRNDQTIRGVRNEDPLDLARTARVVASASTPSTRPANILSGETRDLPGRWDHRWAAPVAEGAPAWIELAWDRPQRLSQVQITFDTGFERELTLSASDSHTARMIRGPQPETVKSYRLSGRTADGAEVELADVTDNHQRLRRHRFLPVELAAVRLTCRATHGVPDARVYEIRCYG